MHEIISTYDAFRCHRTIRMWITEQKCCLHAHIIHSISAASEQTYWQCVGVKLLIILSRSNIIQWVVYNSRCWNDIGIIRVNFVVCSSFSFGQSIILLSNSTCFYCFSRLIFSFGILNFDISNLVMRGIWLKDSIGTCINIFFLNFVWFKHKKLIWKKNGILFIDEKYYVLCDENELLVVNIDECLIRIEPFTYRFLSLLPLPIKCKYNSYIENAYVTILKRRIYLL